METFDVYKAMSTWTVHASVKLLIAECFKIFVDISKCFFIMSVSCWTSTWNAPCGLRGLRIDPLHFLAGCRTRRLNQVLLCLSYILAYFIVLLFIRAPLCVLLVFVGMCSVFWLFWLSYQYLPKDWLERLLWGSLIVARGSSPESPGRRVCMIFLVYCIASLFYYVFVLCPALTWYIVLLLWRDIAYLCWKCR